MPKQSQHIKLADNLSLVWDVESKRLMLVDSENTLTVVLAVEKVISDALVTNTAKTHLQFRDVSGNAIGEPGDKRGDVCFDTEDIFVCVEDYNGSTVIWRRADLTDI